MLARERIAMLLDLGSFNELDLLARHRVHDVGLEERPYTEVAGVFQTHLLFLNVGAVHIPNLHLSFSIACCQSWTSRSPFSGA
jgi:hypothetical protein